MEMAGVDDVRGVHEEAPLPVSAPRRSRPGALRRAPLWLACGAWLVAAAAVTALPARAQDAPAADGADGSAPKTELPPDVPRPDFIANKPYMPDFLLEDKREGWYVTGFPAIGWDDEEGFVLGVMAEVYDNGARDDPFFRSTSYRKRISIAATSTTEGVQDYGLALDAPYLGDTPYRLRVRAYYGQNPLNNYFGRGDEAMGLLRFPGSAEGYVAYDDYERATRAEVGGETYARYSQFLSRDLGGIVMVERDLAGGLVRPLIGIRVWHTDVLDYTGQKVDAVDANGKKVEAVELPTRLREEFDGGDVEGFDGGFDNYVKLGLSVDTRDFEPDPSRGVLGQLAAELGTRALGSDFDYQRVTASVAGFHDLAPCGERVVVAARALYSMQFGDVPFFSENTLAFNTFDITGLGGGRTLRGFKRDRFVGDSAALLNGEVRWSLTEVTQWGQHFRPMLAGFVDTGRVFDGVGMSLERWRVGYGVGFRFAWNLATVVSFDYGRSEESDILYMAFGHAF